jgi:ABC-type multidrug transport system ATPase subunit
MPQEIALYGDFTIYETFQFFGHIFAMSNGKITAKFNELSKLLQLPTNSNFVRELSGGEQRRVSLAIALLHDAKLLILDEPTVGIDPLLREILWNYFERLTANQGKTIIVTTHYVDETRKCHQIGFMRHGKILVQNSPETILKDYRSSTLEDAFLAICMRPTVVHDPVVDAVPAICPKVVEPDGPNFFQLHHVKALFWKNLLWSRRNLM